MDHPTLNDGQDISTTVSKTQARPVRQRNCGRLGRLPLEVRAMIWGYVLGPAIVDVDKIQYLDDPAPEDTVGNDEIPEPWAQPGSHTRAMVAAYPDYHALQYKKSISTISAFRAEMEDIFYDNAVFDVNDRRSWRDPESDPAKLFPADRIKNIRFNRLQFDIAVRIRYPKPDAHGKSNSLGVTLPGFDSLKQLIIEDDYQKYRGGITYEFDHVAKFLHHKRNFPVKIRLLGFADPFSCVMINAHTDNKAVDFKYARKAEVSKQVEKRIRAYYGFEEEHPGTEREEDEVKSLPKSRRWSSV